METILFWGAAAAIAYYAWKKGLKTPEQLQEEEDEAAIDQANPPWRENPNLEYPKIKARPTAAARPAESEPSASETQEESQSVAGVRPESSETMTRGAAHNPFKRGKAEPQKGPKRKRGSYDDATEEEMPAVESPEEEHVLDAPTDPVTGGEPEGEEFEDGRDEEVI